MREKIIKLLTSKVEDDIIIGKELLGKFYKEDIKKYAYPNDYVLLYSKDICEILQFVGEIPYVLYFYLE